MDNYTEQPRYEWSEWIARNVEHNERINAESAQVLTPYGVGAFTIGDLRDLAVTLEAAAFYLSESDVATADGVGNVIADLAKKAEFVDGLLAFCPKPDLGPMPRPPGV